MERINQENADEPLENQTIITMTCEHYAWHNIDGIDNNDGDSNGNGNGKGNLKTDNEVKRRKI